MAAVTGTYETYGAKGIREDLANVIYNISPEDTPFMSNVSRGKATQPFFEWQADSLAAVDTANAVVEGDDIGTFTTPSATARLGNYTQISRKLVLISGTLEETDKAGRKSEIAYQLAKRSAELKRDMEAIALANQGANAGGLTTARTTAGLPAWIKTNVNYTTTDGGNPTYTSGAPTVGRTDGTQRTFTEIILKDVISKVWASGGNPKLLMLGPVNKVRFSSFTGRATPTYYTSAPKLQAVIGAADVYVSDFGTLAVVANRFQRERDGWVVDTEYAGLAFLRPFRTTELAKTGDAEKRMLLVEWGLKVNIETAHGLAADLTTT